MAAITTQQLENASRDADDLGLVVTGAADRPNPGHPNGTVTTRTGQTMRTLANIIDSQETQEEIATEAADRAEDAAATLTDVVTAARTDFTVLAGAPEDNTIWRINGENWPTAPSYTEGFKGWAVFHDGSELSESGKAWGAVETALNPAAAATRLRFTVLSRLIASGDPNRAPFFGADVVEQQFYRTPEQLGVEAGGTIATTTIMLDEPVTPLPTRSYGFVVEAFDASDNLVELGMSQSIAKGGLNTRERGYFRLAPDTTLSGTFIFTDDGVQAKTVYAQFQSAEFQDFSDIARIRKDLNLLEASSVETANVAADRPFSSFWTISDGFESWRGRWTANDVPNGTIISRVVQYLAVETGAVNLRIMLWKRPVATPDNYGFTDGDVLLEETTYSVSALGITPGAGIARIGVPLRTEVVKEAPYDLIWTIQAEKAGAVPARVAIGRTEITSGLNQGRRGWGYGDGSVVPIGPQFALSWAIETDVFVPLYQNNSQTQTTADEVRSCVASVSGRNVAASGSMSRFAAGDIPFSGSVTLDAPATFTVTDEAQTLTYVNAVAAWPFASARLAHANITNMVVKDAATSAVLVLGTDYIADLRFGALALKTAGSARNVLVSYTGSRERYDLIYVNPEFAAVGVVKGTSAIRDAGERVPDAGTRMSGQTDIDIRIPLYNARVTANGVDLVPLWNLRAGYARELQAQVAADTRRNREALARFLGKVERGLATSWDVQGDSITAIQSDVPNRLTPNGPNRDRATANGTTNQYLREGIIAGPLIAAIPTYDTGDGAGAVHTRFGRAWELANAATSRFGGAVTYRNFAIAGTNSDDSFLGMTNPDRLAAWAGAGGDLGIIATGMNDMDMGIGTLFNRVRNMIDAKLQTGADVLVWGCSRPQATAAATDLWLRTNRILRRAAETPGFGGRTAAFIDPVIVSYGPGEGSLGLAAADMCLANGFNHPGIRQHTIEGALARILIFGG